MYVDGGVLVRGVRTQKELIICEGVSQYYIFFICRSIFVYVENCTLYVGRILFFSMLKLLEEFF